MKIENQIKIPLWLIFVSLIYLLICMVINFFDSSELVILVGISNLLISIILIIFIIMYLYDGLKELKC